MDQRTSNLWRDQVWVQLYNFFSRVNCSASWWEVVSCRHYKVDAELLFLGSQLAGAALDTLWPPLWWSQTFPDIIAFLGGLKWLQPVSNKWNDTEMHSVVLKVPVLLCEEEVTVQRDQTVAAKRKVPHYIQSCCRWGGRRVWWQQVYFAILERSTRQSCNPPMTAFLRMCGIELYLSILL